MKIEDAQMQLTGKCDGCGGDYHGALPSTERRYCQVCILARRREQARRARAKPVTHREVREKRDPVHPILPTRRTERLLEYEPVPWLPADKFKGLD